MDSGKNPVVPPAMVLILSERKQFSLTCCSLEDLCLIELFISIFLLRTLKGGWYFGLTSNELHFLPESAILDIWLDLFR